MKLGPFLLTILLSAAVAFGTVQLTGGKQDEAGTTPSTKETTFDRIMRTNTIRCGYVLYEPFVRKDPNTGVFSGVVVDMMDEMGKLLNLKIDWAEEVGWATTVEGLKTGRYDVMCVGFWRQSLEAKHVFYTLPFAYSKLGVIVRADDHRFDEDLNLINQPDIRIASRDGDLSAAVAHRDYPNAKLQQAPNMTTDAQILEDIALNKADVFFLEDINFNIYAKNNPDKLRRLDIPPVRVFQNTLAFLQDEKLKSLLDTVMIELVENGAMDKILDKYDPEKKMLLRIKRPGQP